MLRSRGPLPSPIRRAAASFIDAVVAGAAVAFVAQLSDRWWLGAAAWLIYFVGFAIWSGATPGKLLLGTRIERYSPDTGYGTARQPHLLSAVVRQVVLAGPVWFGQVPLAVTVASCALSLACIAPIVFGANRRGLHDFLARTIVVNVATERPSATG